MRTLLTLLASLGLAACSSGAATSSSAATPESPAPSASPGSPASGAMPALSADGKRFATDAQYKGSCAPAGGRGGCYSFTFHPDGRAEHVLLDATDNGTYRIEGNAVVFRSGLPEAQEDRLESADHFRSLGADYRYVP